jgi:hypothetical protein
VGPACCLAQPPTNILPFTIKGSEWNTAILPEAAAAALGKDSPGESVTLSHSGIAINCEVLKCNAHKQAAHEVTYLVDLAKAEALDYLGDHRAALAVVERHF